MVLLDFELSFEETMQCRIALVSSDLGPSAARLPSGPFAFLGTVSVKNSGKTGRRYLSRKTFARLPVIS